MRKIKLILFFLLTVFIISAQSPGTPKSKQIAKETISKLRLRVIKGEKMEDIARTYSDDKASALKGGLILDVKKGIMDLSFETVAFKLKQGQISEVFETAYGFHFIQLVKKHGALLDLRHVLIVPKVEK